MRLDGLFIRLCGNPRWGIYEQKGGQSIHTISTFRKKQLRYNASEKFSKYWMTNIYKEDKRGGR